MKKEKLSPMMTHYLQTKEEYPDCILFYRLGDFYEMFFDDAKIVSSELELVLTGKDCGLEERAPMCGVPFHSASNYISRLIEKGYKVAVCEQVEDPKLAKGMVKREVVRVVTPGTITESEFLDEKKNNYLAIIFSGAGGFGMSFCDISTGELYVTYAAEKETVINEAARYSPKEVIVNDEASCFADDMELRLKVNIQVLNDAFFTFPNIPQIISEQFGEYADTIDLKSKQEAAVAVCATLRYLEHTQKSHLEHINSLSFYETGYYMDLDAATRRNLEITETMRDKSKRGSLLWVLDETKTSMGARLLKSWLEKPLVNPLIIQKRQYSVRELVENPMLREELGEILGGIYDILRITTRISLNTVTPKDLLALKESIAKLPELYNCLGSAKAAMLNEMYKSFDKLEDIVDYLERSVHEKAGSQLKDGEVIKEGFNEEVDNLRLALKDGKQWVADVENREREKTGIKSLKVSFNKVFGYYIEVTKLNLDSVPDSYIRKQTLTNCERFITQELKELENTILGAGEKLAALESQLFAEIVNNLQKNSERLKKICNIVSTSDVLYSLASVAYKYHYSMPEIYTDGRIVIKDGRHPVVEKMLKDTMFVPNDTDLNNTDDRMLIITGPNMAGKSTYMRQVAVITLMAQIGSFVPASLAQISVVDKIFTRVGASDDISAGQSTFMVEMSEVANILKNATSDSLIILDEIGRGTSTYDGLAIAWSVVEYVQNKKNIGAKTLFATHYHELTELENKLDGVRNYNIAVKKRGDEITFLRKIVPGGADESYGVEVAALAGVPEAVIKRAKKILENIENKDGVKIKAPKKEEEPIAQIGFGEAFNSEIIEELKKIDVTVYTPVEALNKLYELTKKAKEI